MSKWNPVDLTGDPKVEEAIRQYYNRKKYKENLTKVVFVEGYANKERKRVDFSIDNSHSQIVSDEAMLIHNRAKTKAWERHYKADKLRTAYEEMQVEEYCR